MPVKIEQLTADQTALLPKWRDEWTAIGLSTEPADRERAERGVVRAYEIAGLLPPEKIVWCDSPLAMCVARAICLDKRVGASVGDSVGDSVYGQHDAHWLGFYDFFGRVTGLSEDTAKLQGLNEIARSAGWWLPHEKVCWVSERPNLLQRDEQGRLHSLAGPALRYPDGWSIYAVHGLRVPSEFVEDRETIDPKRALTEPNAEHRRALTQILGWDRVLEHVDLSEVARDEYGVLLQTDAFNDDDAPARFVRVSCTTTGRVYHFRVPPDCTTPRHALGWKYHPARPERGRDVDPLWYQPSAQS